jgi:hypothetical protein
MTFNKMDLDSSSEKMAEVKSDVAYFSPWADKKTRGKLSFGAKCHGAVCFG